MRILFVSERAPYLPCPDTARADAAQLLCAFAASHDVGVLATADPIDTDLQRRWPGRRAAFAEVLPAARWRRPLSGDPDVGLTGLQAAFERRVRGFMPDVVYLHGAMIAPLAAATPAACVLTPHAARLSDLAGRLVRSPLDRLAGWFTDRGADAWAHRWFARAASCIVPSYADRALLGRHVPLARVDVVPPGLDLGRYTFRRSGDTDRIVFAGDLGFRPHADAAYRFATSVLPRIRRVRPRAEMILVATAPVGGARRLAHLDGVRIVAPVGDIRPSFWSAAAAVSPFDAAAARRSLVPHAMALGTPVVASPGTTAALPDVIAGHHVLVAERDADLAETVVLLLGHAVVANTVARNARDLVERCYGWSAIAAQYEAVLKRVAGAAGHPVSVAA